MRPGLSGPTNESAQQPENTNQMYYGAWRELRVWMWMW